jgi:hypothetical protein
VSRSKPEVGGKPVRVNRKHLEMLKPGCIDKIRSRIAEDERGGAYIQESVLTSRGMLFLWFEREPPYALLGTRLDP